MSDILQLLNEGNKKLRNINRTLCCTADATGTSPADPALILAITTIGADIVAAILASTATISSAITTGDIAILAAIVALDQDYNSWAQELLDSAGTTTRVFAIGEFHALSILINAGTADITIGAGPTITYTTALSIEFSDLNDQAITIVSTSGTANLAYIF